MVIASNFLEVNTKLDEISGQTLLITSLLKEQLLGDVWGCGDILRSHGSDASDSRLLDDSRLYRLSLGVAFKSAKDFKRAFGRPDPRLKKCKEGLIARFPTDSPSAVFRVSRSDDLTEALAGLEVRDEDKRQAAEYLFEQLTVSLEALLPLVGPRTIRGLRLPAARSVKELAAKIESLEKESVSPGGEWRPSDIAVPYNPGLVARAAGYAAAMHNTFVLTQNDRYSPQDLAAAAPAVDVLGGSNLLLGRTLAQQRLIVGDVELPIIAAMYRAEALNAATLPMWKSWIDKGWLPTTFPSDATAASANAFRRIRDGVLVAVTGNRQLRENLLAWELRGQLASVDMRRQVRVALAQHNFALLPAQWSVEQGVSWRQEDPNKKTPAGWVYRFNGAVQRAQGAVTHVTVENPLPEDDDLVRGALSWGPSTNYLEQLESLTRREAASYVYDIAARTDKRLHEVARRLLDSGVDPMLLIQ